MENVTLSRLLFLVAFVLFLIGVITGGSSNITELDWGLLGLAAVALGLAAP